MRAPNSSELGPRVRPMTQPLTEAPGAHPRRVSQFVSGLCLALIAVLSTRALPLSWDLQLPIILSASVLFASGFIWSFFRRDAGIGRFVLGGAAGGALGALGAVLLYLGNLTEIVWAQLKNSNTWASGFAFLLAWLLAWCCGAGATVAAASGLAMTVRGTLRQFRRPQRVAR